MAAFVAAVAGGCAHYAPAPLPPAATLAAFEARTPGDAALRERVATLFPALAIDWPPARWDRASVLALAIAANDALGVARAEYAAAVGRAAVAGLPADPGLSVQTEYARRERQPWLYGLGLDLTLPSPARRRLDQAIADAEVQAARADLLAQTWQLRQRVATALAAREAGRRRASQLERLAALQQRRADQMDRRVAAGEDAAADALPAREAALHAAAAQADAMTALAEAQAAFAEALGLPAAAADALAVDWPDWGRPPPLAPDLLAARREQALLARADLTALIAAYDAAERRLQRAIARQYPQWVLSPGYEWDHGIVKLPLALGMQLPLFDRNRGEIADASGAREVAGARLVALQAAIHARIDAARAAETLAADALAAAERRAAAAADRQRRAGRALELGAIDRSEALAAGIEAAETALAVLDRQIALQSARLALEDALHAPLSGPETTLASPAGAPR
ncbi:MAG TPA: TolC family protein [Dokdonella sp.]|uniref:TolC family protein n=1 Tax=Dokdonella sp. TaxID=2291710 RepID=UPI002D0793E6|nr:TolC family protein [Dokdonella sp.]HUD41490.1 TolC family protein [Dokdonella sp.]